MGGGAVNINGGLVIESSVNMDLQSSANQQVEGRYSQSFTDPQTLIQVTKEIVDRSELLVAVYADNGTSSDVQAKAGLDLTFGLQFGNGSQDKVLVKAGYADHGLAIHEWTECEDSTTPPLKGSY